MADYKRQQILEPLDIYDSYVIYDEIYENVGSEPFGLGIPTRPFSIITISTFSNKKGCILRNNIDYLLKHDLRLSNLSDKDIFNRIRVINKYYMNRKLFISYTAHGSYIEASTIYANVNNNKNVKHTCKYCGSTSIVDDNGDCVKCGASNG